MYQHHLSRGQHGHSVEVGGCDAWRVSAIVSVSGIRHPGATSHIIAACRPVNHLYQCSSYPGKPSHTIHGIDFQRLLVGSVDGARFPSGWLASGG